MSKPIYDLMDELPRRSLTVGLLHAMDWVVPGEYVNLVGFEDTIRAITGETDPDYVKKVGVRAIELFNDTTQGYQRGLWIYQAADSIQGLSGFASFVEQVSNKVGFLKWMGKLTPKSETTQTIDLAVKLVAEVVGFCTVNGMPGDSVGEFVESLTDYRHEAKMRLATMIAVDGVLPLGPDFLSKAIDLLNSSKTVKELKDNDRFQRMRGMIPGDAVTEQVGFIQKSMDAMQGFVTKFVSDNNITQNRVLDSVKGISDKYEGTMDFIAAALDLTCDYFEHTGIQSVTRSLITRATSEV